MSESGDPQMSSEQVQEFVRDFSLKLAAANNSAEWNEIITAGHAAAKASGTKSEADLVTILAFVGKTAVAVATKEIAEMTVKNGQNGDPNQPQSPIPKFGTLEKWIRGIALGSFILASLGVIYHAIIIRKIGLTWPELRPYVVGIFTIALLLSFVTFGREHLQSLQLTSRTKKLFGIAFFSLFFVLITAVVAWLVMLMFADALTPVKAVPDSAVKFAPIEFLEEKLDSLRFPPEDAMVELRFVAPRWKIDHKFRAPRGITSGRLASALLDKLQLQEHVSLDLSGFGPVQNGSIISHWKMRVNGIELKDSEVMSEDNAPNGSLVQFRLTWSLVHYVAHRKNEVYDLWALPDLDV